MDPQIPDSFNLQTKRLSTGRLYRFVDQKPVNFDPKRTCTLLCLHGLPDSWYCWRYQIGPWVRKGARVIAPDMLGYGSTDKPKDPAEYSPKKLCDDLAALLDLLDVKTAAVIGHDWGAFTAGRFALWYPSRLFALVIMSVPYTPPSPVYIPVEEIVKRAPNLGYQAYLADQRSTAHIDSNLVSFVDIVFRSPSAAVEFTTVGALEKAVKEDKTSASSVLNEKEREFYISHLSKGMEGPLNYVRTFKIRHEEEKGLPAHLRSDLPVLFIWGTLDTTTTKPLIRKSHKFIPRLQEVALEGKGHWVMIEAKDEVTEIVASWLQRMTSTRPHGDGFQPKYKLVLAMSSTPVPPKDDSEDVPPPERPPSPPPHTTFAARGVHPPTFSAFKPRDYRLPSQQAMTHVAWSCDGKKLAAVGIDKITRVWTPEKSMEFRSATSFSGGHSDDVDYVSWNPTHPELFCTSSQKDRRIVFWDARQSRYIQQCSLKVSPVQTCFSPDGRSLLYTSAGHQTFSMTLGKDPNDAKEQWHLNEREPVTGSTVIFNHAGDGILLTHNSEHAIRVMDFPSLTMRESPAAHVGGCLALALDPRGRYLASGGHDSIVNLFDLSDWMCSRTITSCEYSINSLSFSPDGEYLAIASAGMYIDICATETGMPLHRVPALAPSPTVTWHPSKYVIAYCGQTKIREGGPPPVAVISMFGLLE